MKKLEVMKMTRGWFQKETFKTEQERREERRRARYTTSSSNNVDHVPLATSTYASSGSSHLDSCDSSSYHSGSDSGSCGE